MTNYRYYNRNPVDADINDCVCRAISTCTGLSYGATDRLLSIVAEANQCDKLCVCCYNRLLKTLGYRRRKCRHDETVGDIARRYKDFKVIIRISGHLTAALYGLISDTQDCSDNYADCYWVVE